jgi:GAF domain-containing protein
MLTGVGGPPYRRGVGQGNERTSSRRYGDVVLPVVAAALPTAVFQVPNLVGVPVSKAVLVIVALAVFVGVVVWQAVRARRTAAARRRAEDAGATALAAYEVAVQYGFGQIATRLTRFAAHDHATRRSELGAFADRAAAALAFYLLPHVPDVRANVYLLAPSLDALEPIGHGGAGDTAGVFHAGTPYGDRNLDWVLQGGPPRVVGDRESDVDAVDDEPDFDPRYRSYVAVVIRGEGYSFGMLTVDCPTPDAFTDLDVRNVGVVAQYVGVACTLAFPVRHQQR